MKLDMNVLLSTCLLKVYRILVCDSRNVLTCSANWKTKYYLKPIPQRCFLPLIVRGNGNDRSETFWGKFLSFKVFLTR